MEFYGRWHNKTKGVKGIVVAYSDYVKNEYMVTEKAKKRLRMLLFWEKHGLKATLDAFPVKRSILFNWKKIWSASGKKPESLNERSRTPKARRKRIWDCRIIEEIKRLRNKDVHPNLGSEKLYPELRPFCDKIDLVCPKPRTIARLYVDCGGLRSSPHNISHFGKIKLIKRQERLIKPKDFKVLYPGHLVALDTIEKHINGIKRYVITFEDIYTRFSFAWATNSHASLAAKEFFEHCLRAFPYSFAFLHVLTDNGSEFKKHFAEELKKLHLTHYHIYPKTPRMNAHVERFNRTIQEEFIDFHIQTLANDINRFNSLLIDYLIWYNTKRVHWAFKNRMSPVQYMLSLSTQSIFPKMSLESKNGWHYTDA